MLTEIQQKLLQMMKEIDEICRADGIHYSLGGGTAIGAIRHRGFIPWDDDIDLYMTRDNWEKFMAAEAAGKFPANRVIESAETDINYTNTIGRYVATDSSSVHSHQIISSDPAGHVIDVFVFDPLSYSNYKKFLEDFMLYSDLLDETKGYSSRFDMNLLRYPEMLARCKAGQKKQVIDDLIASFTNLDDPGWEHYIMEWGVAPFLFPASIFSGGYIRVPFEDTTVEIVRNYGEYLIWQYGDDWEYIPDHEGREGHDAIFSSTIPYTTVREDYMPFIDAGKLRSAYQRRKLRLLQANPHRRKAEEAEMKQKAMECREQFLARAAKRGIRPSIFEDYFKVQLSPEFAGRRDKHSTLRRYSYPVRIPIGEDMTVMAAEILMRTERMGKAKRLIDIYTGDFPENFREKRRKSERLQALNEEILFTRRLTNEAAAVEAVVRDNPNIPLLEKLCEVLESACGRYSGNSYLMRLRVKALRQLRDALEASMATLSDETETQNTSEENKAAEEKKKIAARIKRVKKDLRSAVYFFEALAPEGSPAHAEAEKYLADINGADDEEYLRIYKETRNGCIRLEIADYLAAKGIEVPEDPEAESAAAGEEIDAESQDSVENSDFEEVAEAEVEASEADAEAEAEAKAADGAGAETGKGAAAESGKTDFYSFAKNAYRKIASKDDRLKEEAWEIACRTRDRIVLLEKYADRIDSLRAMLEAGDWEGLKKEMAPYHEAVMRNLDCGLGLEVHPQLQEIEYALLRNEGREDLAEKIDSLVPEQHRKPIAEI